MSLIDESRTHDNAPATGLCDEVTGEGLTRCCRALRILWSPLQRVRRTAIEFVVRLGNTQIWRKCSSPISGAVQEPYRSCTALQSHRGGRGGPTVLGGSFRTGSRHPSRTGTLVNTSQFDRTCPWQRVTNRHPSPDFCRLRHSFH
jgi:hypothetical protein